MDAIVTNIQRFSTHDGPGVRTVVFFKGCPLRCIWCHNPETGNCEKELYYVDRLCIGCGACVDVCKNGVHVFSNEGHRLERNKCIGCMKCVATCPTGALETAGKEYSVSEICDIVLRDKAFYGESGGVTLSGGEPSMHPEFIIELLEKLKAENVSTAMETCGRFAPELLERLVHLVDLFLWDIKDTDSGRHLENTGVPTEPILENLKNADSMGAKTVLRCIMVSGVNMNEAHYENLLKIKNQLKNCVGIELLPYHTFGSDKAVQLGKESNAYPEFVPTDEQMKKAEKFINADL